jgi:CheY-like chemotaxis protein
MSSKRALVVDDSKSARAFLARILERHEIAVDAAESAEAAIDYLTRNRPDVIFMDHLMPGMDGFQAVQSIKNNPRTSSIPILMYTSQEGDLYLGQARALGAEGVLPKQIKQADVTRMLFQLRLVSDRRTGDQTTYTGLENVSDLVPANESAIVVEPPAAAAAQSNPDAHAGQQFGELLPKLTLEIRAAFDATLQKEIAALRHYLGGRLDAQSDRLQGDLAALLPGPGTPEPPVAPMIPERSAASFVGWLLAVLAVMGVAAMTWLWWNRGGEIAALNTDLSAAYAELETLRAQAAAVAAASASEPVPAVEASVTDPDAVLPDTDASLDAQPAAAGTQVQLVPTGGVVTPPPDAPAAAMAAPSGAGTPVASPPSQPAQ